MQLTHRQKEVVSRVVKGVKRQAIASELEISIKTVDFHLVRIRRKFGVTSMLEIAVFFARKGYSDKS